MSKEQMLKELSDCVVDMEDEEVINVAEKYLAAGYEPLDGVLKGLVNGMNRASDLYEEEEYYIPELLICSDAMYNGLDVLRPHIDKEDMGIKGKIVIGVVQGDTHDIGKNLVKIMLETAGYEVFDLGRDVPLQAFIDKVREENADVLALSTLMSTSMANMGEIVKLIEANGMRDRVKIVIGGAPVSWAFARKIGADGYSSNAIEAVSLIDSLLNDKCEGVCNETME